MSSYNIRLSKHRQQNGPVARWWLDKPMSDENISLQSLTDEGIVFQGWVLAEKAAKLQLYIQSGDEIRIFSPEVARPDVIEIILKQAPAQHPQLMCGFRLTVRVTTADFEFGVIAAQTRVPLCEGHISGPFKVLTGKDDWLFLDNDTNKSVEQFTGKLLLDTEACQGWLTYFDHLHRYAASNNCQHALLIAPAKEAVYPDFYPYAKATVTPIDQLLQLLPSTIRLCYPVDALRHASSRSFRITDTHWSPFGAMIASVELAVALGLDRAALQTIFAQDQYRHTQLIGDLGNKKFPPQSSEEWLLKGFNHRKFLVSDNGLSNFGRMLSLVNPTALEQKHLVIFGASSSYSMLDYLCRIFGKITLMHTAGSIDPEILAKLAPAYLVCQTNARYVIKAPVPHYSMAEVIAEKNRVVN